MDTITVITGLVKDVYINDLIESYKDIRNKLLSTWKDTNSEVLHKFEQNGFLIVVSERPILDNSVNYQTVLAQNGILKARELGFQYVCRSRTDVFPQNHLVFLEKTRELYKENITVLCGVELFHIHYFLDIIVCGKIENMLLFFCGVKQKGDTNPERFWLDNYAKEPIHTKEDVKRHLNFANKICKENNIEIIWYRPYDCISFPRTIPYTKVISEYCNAYFVFE